MALKYVFLLIGLVSFVLGGFIWFNEQKFGLGGAVLRNILGVVFLVGTTVGVSMIV